MPFADAPRPGHGLLSLVVARENASAHVIESENTHGREVTLMPASLQTPADPYIDADTFNIRKIMID